MAAESIQIAPVTVWQGKEFTEKFLASKMSLPSTAVDDDDNDGGGDQYSDDQGF